MNCWGWATEEISRPDAKTRIQGRHVSWEKRNCSQRLLPHALGWIPFLIILYIIIDNFYYNLSPESSPPSYVYIIVVGELLVFSSFAGPQIFQQLTDYGCKHYWWGELTYILLSFFSKGLLGLVLMVNVIGLSSFGEAFVQD
jgi:hypothetical protein